ncbi:MAG: galactose mutarotase [Muribaculaceae bacterium]|nr:galactose mutarotase [Muribaculaceae bacterium]
MKVLGKKVMLGFLGSLLLSSCVIKEGKSGGETTLSGLDPAYFTTVIDGDTTRLIILENKNGMEVCLSNYGARIVSMMVPDKEGKPVNVVLGFDSIQAYFPEVKLPKLGGTLGRYAGRIGYGRFILEGDTIDVTKNDFGHCLHSGSEDGDKGWQYKIFKIAEKNDSSVLMTFVSPDGENGFPGSIKANIRFTLTQNNSLRINYSAVTDKPTVICLSNQSYFNLSGDPDNSVTDQRLNINASSYLPVDSTRLVIGEICSVEGTPLDFREEKSIGRDIDNAWNEQIRYGRGYDHAFILDTRGDLTQKAVSLYCKKSGVEMNIFTTEPAIQFYSGNFLYSSLSRKQNENFSQRHGLSLEPLHYPDSPNHPEWPNVILLPGEEYNSTTIYSFRCR